MFADVCSVCLSFFSMRLSKNIHPPVQAIPSPNIGVPHRGALLMLGCNMLMSNNIQATIFSWQNPPLNTILGAEVARVQQFPFKSHGPVVPRVTGSSPTPSMATGGMAAVTLAAGLLGVQVCAGPVAERLGNRFPVWKGLQRKFQDGSKSNMGGSAVGFFPGAKERVSWCITFIELGSLAEGAHIGSYQMHPFQTLV